MVVYPSGDWKQSIRPCKGWGFNSHPSLLFVESLVSGCHNRESAYFPVNSAYSPRHTYSNGMRLGHGDHNSKELRHRMKLSIPNGPALDTGSVSHHS